MVSNDVRDIYNDLKAEGRAVGIRYVTVTGGDHATGDPGTETPVTLNTYAIEEEMTIEKIAQLASDLPGVTTDDRRYMVAAMDSTGAELTITTAMKLVDGTAVKTIAIARPFKPAGEILYWTVLARGA